MRYDEMVAFHNAHGADVTVAVSEVPIEEASRYGIIALDDEDRVVSFDEKPAQPRATLCQWEFTSSTATCWLSV